MIPIWLHSMLLTLLMTIVPALVVILTLSHAPLRLFLGIDGPSHPLPILIFLGLPIVGQLLFRYALKARCPQCGGRAKFTGAIPSRYSCTQCKAIYKTQIGPVKQQHRGE